MRLFMKINIEKKKFMMVIYDSFIEICTLECTEVEK